MNEIKTSTASIPATLSIQSVLASTIGGEQARGVHVVGDHAYVADGLAGLQLIDVSQPTHLVSLGHFDTSGVAYSVQVESPYAYVGDFLAGLQVIHVGDT